MLFQTFYLKKKQQQNQRLFLSLVYNGLDPSLYSTSSISRLRKEVERKIGGCVMKENISLYVQAFRRILH